jgi:hypothetical protein
VRVRPLPQVCTDSEKNRNTVMPSAKQGKLGGDGPAAA